MNKPPAVGDYYRLPNGYRKPAAPGQHWSHADYSEAGIYIVTFTDINKVELRLVSKLAFNGSGRRWLRKSKMTASVTHTEFQAEFKDDAISYLTTEFNVVRDGYVTVLGNQI